MDEGEAGQPGNSGGQRLAAGCEHGAACHAGLEPALGTAPERSRGWLLIEHEGPRPAEPLDAQLPGPLGKLAVAADEAGVRVQLIRRPGRWAARVAGAPPTLFAGWTTGSPPWLRRGDAAAAEALSEQVPALAEGAEPSFGTPAAGPLFLVCTHGRRDACCARLGAPLARALDAAYPGEVWESTHVGGHRYAANLVILPHGLYYGPVDAAAGAAAIEAYRRGQVAPGRYRGRAGQPRDAQEDRYRAMAAAGDFGLTGLDA